MSCLEALIDSLEPCFGDGHENGHCRCDGSSILWALDLQDMITHFSPCLAPCRGIAAPVSSTKQAGLWRCTGGAPVPRAAPPRRGVPVDHAGRHAGRGALQRAPVLDAAGGRLRTQQAAHVGAAPLCLVHAGPLTLWTLQQHTQRADSSTLFNSSC